jgi:hypothetical protein
MKTIGLFYGGTIAWTAKGKGVDYWFEPLL